MGGKAEYKSAIRSRRLIQQAFVDLLQEKNLEKITVTDIITRADINRGTFYAHYQDTRAVIEQIEKEIVEKMMGFLSGFQYENFFNSPMPLLLNISCYLEKDLEFYRTLVNSSISEQLLDKLRRYLIAYLESNSNFPEHIKRSLEFMARINFFTSGIIDLYQIWFRREMNCSLDELSQEISKLIISNAMLFYEK